MYGDEGHSLFVSQQPLLRILKWLKDDQNPPLYFFMLHVWIKVFDLNLTTLKCISIFFSSLAASSFFLFLNKITTRQIAFFGALLFTFCTAQIFFSREVRCFAFVQFLTIISSWFFYEALIESKKRRWIFLAIVNALLLFTHYLTAFIILVQVITTLSTFRKEDILRSLKSNILTLLFLSPWMPFAISNIPKSGSFWMKSPTWNDFFILTSDLFGGKVLLCFFTVVFLIGIVISAFYYKRASHKSNFTALLYFSGLFILPPLFDFLLSAYTPVFQYRYFLYSTIGLFAALSICVHIMFQNLNSIALYSAAFTVLCINFYYVNINPPKGDDWNLIVPRVMKQMTDETVVIISAPYKFKEFAYYFDKDAFRDYKNTDKILAKKNVFGGHKLLNDLMQEIKLQGIERVILVQSHNLVVDPNNDLEKFVNANGFEKYDEYQKDSKSMFAGVKVSSYISSAIAEKVMPVDCNQSLNFSFEDWSVQCVYNPITMDTSLQVQRFYMNKQNDTLALPPTESNCEYVDNNKLYGPNFNLNEKQLPFIKTIRGKAEIWLSDTLKAPAIVISIDDKNGNIFYKDFYITQNKKDYYNKWRHLKFVVTIPDNIRHDATLKMYLYAGDMKSKVYLRSLKLDLKLKKRI